MRLSTAVDQFLEDSKVRLTKQTIKLYRSDLELLVSLAHVDKGDSVLMFTPELVRQYFVRLSQERAITRDGVTATRSLSMATLHRRRTSVRQFATWCLMRRLVAEDPMKDAPRIRRPRRLPRPLPPDVHEWIDRLELGPVDRVLRALLFQAGLRVAEVCGLTLDHVRLGRHDHEGELLILGKGSKERVVPLTVELWRQLHAFLKDAPIDRTRSPLFAQRDGRAWSEKMVQARVKEWGRRATLAARQAGVVIDTGRVTAHRFRHTFATELLERGADLRQVQELLGHESMDTTAIYTAVTSTRRRQAVNLLSPVKGISSPVLRPAENPPSEPSDKLAMAGTYASRAYSLDFF
jgi:site-specific recombinase XerD